MKKWIAKKAIIIAEKNTRFGMSFETRPWLEGLTFKLSLSGVVGINPFAAWRDGVVLTSK